MRSWNRNQLLLWTCLLAFGIAANPSAVWLPTNPYRASVFAAAGYAGPGDTVGATGLMPIAEEWRELSPFAAENSIPAGEFIDSWFEDATSREDSQIDDSVENPSPDAGRTRIAGTRTIRRVCRVTAYCDKGQTASGRMSGVGQCAIPGDIPLGTSVYIPSLKKKLVGTDRTHRRFRHNTVDIFIPSKDACLLFGRKYLEVEFTIEPDVKDKSVTKRLAAR